VRKIFVLLLSLLIALPAQSQIRRRVVRVVEPSLWGSLGVGLFNGNDVSDGETESVWDFGRSYNPQYRAALEKAISRTASIGLTGTYMHAPFTYIGPVGDFDRTRTPGHLDVITLGASVHVGGGVGLHQVLEATAGALAYRNLERDSDRAALPPVNGNIDPYFTFGYGFGYSFDPITQISIVQDFGLALHERTGLTSEDSNTLTQRTIRLNFRYGFGNRARTRR
jgi:hypothetical protein